MTYYKIIAGNGRTYVTSQDIETNLLYPTNDWLPIRTVDGLKVWINHTNIAAIEVMDEYQEEPSETQQIINATIGAFFGGQPRTRIDIGEHVEADE